MHYLNLTGCDIIVGEKTISKSDITIRVNKTTTSHKRIDGVSSLSMCYNVFGKLPETDPEVILIVHRDIIEAYPYRSDLAKPSGSARFSGNTIICDYIEINQPTVRIV